MLLLGHGRGNLRRLSGAAVLGALTSLSTVALMGLSAWLISRAAQHPSPSSLTLAAVGVRALGLSRACCRYGERLLGHSAALRAVADLRVSVFTSLARGEQARRRSGDALSTVVDDVDAVQDLTVRCLLPLAGAVVVLVSTTLFCALLLPSAAVVLAMGLTATLVLVPVAGALGSRHDVHLAERRSAYQVEVLDLVAGCADLVVCGAVPATLARVEALAEELSVAERRRSHASALVSVLGPALQGLTVLAVITVTLEAVQRGDLSPVQLAVLVLVALAAFEPFLVLGEAGSLLPRTAGAARRLAALLVRTPAHVPLVTVEDVTVRLKRASYSYPGSPRPAVMEADLELAPGSRVAVVGGSGAGKSTLLRLLAGQLTPDVGSARIGPWALGTLSEVVRARHVIVVEQDAHLFDATLRDNVLIGRPLAGADELAAVAVEADLDRWLAALPEGWGTRAGARVSGGERKRLCVARGLLSRPDVLLLDEPTEGLDPVAADAMLRRLVAHAGDHALLVVTHRLAALEGFDEVVLLEGGRVVRRGTPAELREAGLPVMA